MAQMVDEDFKRSAVRHSDELELLIQCHDVVKSDSFSSSDPFVKVYEKRSNRVDPNTNEKIEGFVLIGQTEHLEDTSNPVFETKFKIEYFFEETQIIKFECYDYDKDGTHDLLGSCEMNLGKILNSPGSIRADYLVNKKGKRLKNGSTRMYQTVVAELNVCCILYIIIFLILIHTLYNRICYNCFDSLRILRILRTFTEFILFHLTPHASYICVCYTIYIRQYYSILTQQTEIFNSNFNLKNLKKWIHLDQQMLIFVYTD